MRILILCALLLCFCQKQRTEKAETPALPENKVTPLAQKATTNKSATALTPGESLYQLEMMLSDQDGKTFPLTSLRGQLVIVSMFYAHCPNACPMLIHKIQTIEKKLTDTERSNLKVVLVSLAPDADTDSVLKGLAKKQEVDETRWRFTRTTENSVRDLSAVLGINYRKLDDGNYNHSSIITLLDRQGLPVAKMEGLADPIEPILERFRAELSR